MGPICYAEKPEPQYGYIPNSDRYAALNVVIWVKNTVVVVTAGFYRFYSLLKTTLISLDSNMQGGGTRISLWCQADLEDYLAI